MLLNLSTVLHFTGLCFLTYTLNRNTKNINCLRITYKLNVLPKLSSHSTNIAEAARYATFSSSPNLIRTYLNHLIRFLNYRCTNSGLITQKHSILGILGTHVPVHPEHVPVHFGHWWGVPVHPCKCTGTPSEICPDFASFATFATNSLYTTSIIPNTSRIIMEFILKQLHNT